MVKSFFSSVRARLLFLMLIPVAFVLIVSLYYLKDQHENRETEKSERIESATGVVAQARRQNFASTEAFLVRLSDQPSVRAASLNPELQETRAACYNTLAESATAIASTVSFGLFDASGDRICSSQGDQRGGLNVADRIDMQTALATRQYAIGEVVDTKTAPVHPILTLTMPIFSQGRDVIAFLRMGFDVGESTPLLLPEDVPSSGSLSVVDHNGRVISSSSLSPGSELPFELNGIAVPSLTAALTDVAGPDTRTFVSRVTADEQTPVYVVMTVPASAVTVALTDAFIPELPIALAVCLLMLAGAWWLAEVLISRRASELTAAARRIADGDFAYAAALQGDDSELGRVSSALGDMARQLGTTIQQLTSALEAKDEFLNSVSHELRTPVTAILGYSTVLVERGQALKGDVRQEAIEDVHDNALRLRRIIENLLVLARLETGTSLEVEPLILRRVLTRNVESHRRTHPERTYTTVFPVDLVVVEGNQQCVEQIMDNLLSNAEKYSGKDTPICIRAAVHGGQLTVAVEDKGIGVDPGEAQRLFDPFYRSSRSHAISGVGLGLTVCMRLVEAQGGKLAFRPNEGGGSIFEFTIPIAAEALEDLEDVEHASEPQASRDEMLPEETGRNGSTSSGEATAVATT